MSKSTVIELSGRDESRDPLTEMLRVGAQQLIQQAVGPNCRTSLPSMPSAERQPVPLVSCATAISQNATYRPAWGQSRLRFPG